MCTVGRALHCPRSAEIAAQDWTFASPAGGGAGRRSVSGASHLNCSQFGAKRIYVDKSLVLQLLEGLSDSVVGLDICERALDRRPGLAACHFLADYLTLHFQRQVSPARRQHIHALHLGSKVCECVERNWIYLLIHISGTCPLCPASEEQTVEHIPQDCIL